MVKGSDDIQAGGTVGDCAFATTSTREIKEEMADTPHYITLPIISQRLRIGYYRSLEGVLDGEEEKED